MRKLLIGILLMIPAPVAFTFVDDGPLGYGLAAVITITAVMLGVGISLLMDVLLGEKDG